MPSNNKAGDRWSELYNTVETVQQNSQYFEENEIDFAERMSIRLLEYGENAYITVPQINFIHRLAEQLERLHL